LFQLFSAFFFVFFILINEQFCRSREANSELNKKESEIEAMKAQAKGLAREYDRVCDELQAKDSCDKKSE
jgi:hypothetical protein